MAIKDGCGNPDCCVSTGICESLTFGSGKLNEYGYWENECWDCARAWEKHHPQDSPCWPFKPEDIANDKQSL